MHTIHRSLFAAATLLSAAAGPAMSQATVGPAGGIPSTTAPANGEGTPAGGTGTLSTTRVGPSTTRPVRHYHPRRHAVAHATKAPTKAPATAAPATPAPMTATPAPATPASPAPATPVTPPPSK